MIIFQEGGSLRAISSQKISTPVQKQRPPFSALLCAVLFRRMHFF